jgi:antitoxin component HigA of HigAB toxin-antitoxin module
MRFFPAILLSIIAAIPAGAVIVDGVAIAVGNKVITQSEIDERIRLTAFQNGEKLDFSLDSRKEAAQKLIDQRLIEREMEVGRYPHLEPKVREGLLGAYEKTHYKSDANAMVAALREYGLTAQELEDDLALQAELLTFLNLRFLPAVQVTDEDVRKYFDEQMTHGTAKITQEAQTAALNQMRDAIEEKLTTERANKELDMWLQDQRKRTRIEYVTKDLAETAK